MQYQVRHGDLLIVRVDSIPEGATKRKGKTLAEGEATGHAHTLEAGGQLYERDGRLYFRASKKTAVVHQEQLLRGEGHVVGAGQATAVGEAGVDAVAAALVTVVAPDRGRSSPASLLLVLWPAASEGLPPGR